jgi:hypothetical protein
MYKRRLVPASFTPPARQQGHGFHLRMLTIHDVVKDFDAVMTAGDRLKGAMEQGSTWPDGLTLEENLIDLAWHQREFTIGHSFAYTVMNDDESRCLGCGYINPPDGPTLGGLDFDAVAFYWARDPAFDATLGTAFRALVAQFPLPRVAYPGRDQPWPAPSGPAS